MKEEDRVVKPSHIVLRGGKILVNLAKLVLVLIIL